MMRTTTASSLLVLFLTCFVISVSARLEDRGGEYHQKRGRIRASGRSWDFTDDKKRRHRFGRLDLKELDFDGDELEVQLLSDERIQLFRQARSRRPHPGQSWKTFYGETEDDGVDDSITIVETMTDEGVKSIAGSVVSNGTVYQIRQLPDEQVIVEETNGSDFDPEWEGPLVELDESETESTIDLVDGLEENPGSRNLRGGNSSLDHRRLDAVADVDIMVLYTNGAMCAAASKSAGCSATAANKAPIENLIKLAVAETNKAYELSNIDIELNLVKIHYEASYDDSAAWETTLSRLKSNGDGYMDYVHAQRNQYGADFVSMLVNSDSYCGIGYRPGSPDPNSAFSLTKWSCATGYYSFGHEVAHNMGCNHDRANAGGSGSYNYGYQMNNGNSYNSRFRSIMAYDCPSGCPRVGRFSNPSVKYNGKAIGNSQANNAQYIQDRRFDYAGFRQSQQSNPGPPPTPSPTAPPPVGPAPTSPPTARPTQPPVPMAYTPGVLVASMDGGYIGAAGNMFDIVAQTDVTVTNFAVHAYSATTVTIEVYKLKSLGSCQGHQDKPNDWEKIGTVTTQSADSEEPTVLPLGFMNPVTVKKGTRQAFYVTFQEATNYNRYSPGTQFGKTHSSNQDIQFIEGYAVAYKFGDEFSPRVFNGIIYYVDGVPNVTPPPVALPPTPRPTSPPIPQAIVPVAGPINSLTTLFAGGNGQAGNMFDIKATSKVTIRSFDIHSYSTSSQQVFIFTRKGSYVGSDTDRTKWTLICDTTVKAQGSPIPTPIPSNVVQPVTIEAGQTQSFYVTLAESTIRYTNGAVNAGDANIQFVRSAGKRYPFGDTYPDRIWNGKVHYTVEGVTQRTAPAPGPVGANGPLKKVMTTYANRNGSYGSMFQVKAKRKLIIDNLSIHTYHHANVAVEVYKMKELNKSHVNRNQDPNAWELVGSAQVQGKGTGSPSSLPPGSLKPITIPAGQFVSLYVTIPSGGLRYSNGDSTSLQNLLPHTETDDLIVYEGVGIGSARFGGAFNFRVFNGVLEYYTPGVAGDMAADGVPIETSADALLDSKKREGEPCEQNSECRSNFCGSPVDQGGTVSVANLKRIRTRNDDRGLSTSKQCLVYTDDHEEDGDFN